MKEEAPSKIIDFEEGLRELQKDTLKLIKQEQEEEDNERRNQRIRAKDKPNL